MYISLYIYAHVTSISLHFYLYESFSLCIISCPRCVGSSSRSIAVLFFWFTCLKLGVPVGIASWSKSERTWTTMNYIYIYKLSGIPFDVIDIPVEESMLLPILHLQICAGTHGHSSNLSKHLNQNPPSIWIKKPNVHVSSCLRGHVYSLWPIYSQQSSDQTIIKLTPCKPTKGALPNPSTWVDRFGQRTSQRRHRHTLRLRHTLLQTRRMKLRSLGV